MGFCSAGGVKILLNDALRASCKVVFQKKVRFETIKMEGFRCFGNDFKKWAQLQAGFKPLREI